MPLGVRTMAAEYGLGQALAGWRLTSADAISFDGSVIAGSGINPRGQGEAFMVVLPEPTLIGLPVLGIFFFGRRRARAALIATASPSAPVPR